jgi:hypothetical protein
MSNSWLSRPLFFPVVVASLLAGNAIDLIGTYVHQPEFQHEGNVIYGLLKSRGYSPGWPVVIAAKSAVCVIGAIGLHRFLRKRRTYYRHPSATFREFITQVFYGRPLTWFETFYRIPRFVPTVLGCFAVFSVGGPYFAYLGYENLAGEYGWPTLGGFWIGSLWIDYGVIIWVFSAITWLVWDMWRDYRELYLDGSAI